MNTLLKPVVLPLMLARDCVRVWYGPLPSSLKRRVIWAHIGLAVRGLIGPRMFAGRLLGYQLAPAPVANVAFLFREIFVDLDYHFDTAVPAPFIVDCGSNIGLAILFFKSLYPNARIVAFEPGDDSFALLQHNVVENGITGVDLHAAAVGDTDGMVDFYRGEQPGSFTSSTAADRAGHRIRISVPQLTVSSFIDAEVDFLKMDVEGSEWGVLRDLCASGRIRQVRQMVIEYHHHLRPGEDRLADFLGQLEQHGFGYQLKVSGSVPRTVGEFQDVVIFAYRKTPKDEDATARA